MDLDQQEALNAIQNSVYRTALKLRAVQSLCQLDVASASLVERTLPAHQCRDEKQNPLTVEQLSQLLKELFRRARLETPGQVQPKAQELTLSLLTAAYDRNGVGFIQPRSAAVALIALSGDNLLTKYRAFFQLYATCAGRGPGRSFQITRNGVKKLLTDLLQILIAVGESRNMANVEIATHSCFSGVLTSAVGEERFLAWLQSEPALLLWLPTCYRLLAAEMVPHWVKCNVCNSFPITGLRYRCLKCLNFDLCQVCFFTGQHRKPHKKSHPVVEQCVPMSAKENAKLFFRTIRNNLLQGRCRRKEAVRREALLLVGEADSATHSQALPCPVQPISLEQPESHSWFPSMPTLDLQLSSPVAAKVSQPPLMENDSRSSGQGKTSHQALASLKVELAQAQESIKALQSHRRYLKNELNKWKSLVRHSHSAQEDRHRALEAKLRELIASQENLRVEVKEMRLEIQNIHIRRKKPLKERSLQNGSFCSPLKPNQINYSKYTPLVLPCSCAESKGPLEPQDGLLSRNSGSPEITLKSEVLQTSSPEAAHLENPEGSISPRTTLSGEQNPETNRDHPSSGMKIRSFSSPAATETLLRERQVKEEGEEEEELQEFMMELKEVLSCRVPPDQLSIVKEGLLSTAERVCKSFSDLISRVTWPIWKCEDGEPGPSLMVPDKNYILTLEKTSLEPWLDDKSSHLYTLGEDP